MKIRRAFILFLLVVNSYAHASINDDDWKNYITSSCKPTITGSIKRALGETGFWAHVNVSMDSWAEGMRIDKPEDYCYIDYQRADQREKLMQCLAYQQEKWQWYTRCKPIVVDLCRKSGGRCN